MYSTFTPGGLRQMDTVTDLVDRLFPDASSMKKMYRKVAAGETLNEVADELEQMKPMRFGNAHISRGDLLGQQTATSLWHCEMPGSEENWSFDRVGPFKGTGNIDWNSAYWSDAGMFTKKFDDGPLSVTAFGFFPVDEHGQILALPPIKIHHVHATSSQIILWGNRLTPDGHIAVEFDLHGDRQCKHSRGGTDCLLRAFPPGFGMHLDQPLWGFFDVNDVRAKSAPILTFYSIASFRWTRGKRRPVGKIFTGTLPALFTVGSHDDFLLPFSSDSLTEFISWSEHAMTFNASVVRAYWHTHHGRTTEQWLLAGEPSQLGLMQQRYSTSGGTCYICMAKSSGISNLTAHGLTANAGMDDVLNHLDLSQKSFYQSNYKQYPQMLCQMRNDIWELVGGHPYERYSAPDCSRWDFISGNSFTIVAFHTVNPLFPVKTHTELYWMHVALYLLYVPNHEGGKIPHASH